MSLLSIRNWRSAVQIAVPKSNSTPLLKRQPTNHPYSSAQVLACVVGGSPAGFACIVTREKREWGILLDNLHVLPAYKRKGLASMLLRRCGAWVREQFPETAMHLSVYTSNAAAVAFYEALGGQRCDEFTYSGMTTVVT